MLMLAYADVAGASGVDIVQELVLEWSINSLPIADQLLKISPDCDMYNVISERLTLHDLLADLLPHLQAMTAPDLQLERIVRSIRQEMLCSIKPTALMLRCTEPCPCCRMLCNGIHEHPGKHWCFHANQGLAGIRCEASEELCASSCFEALQQGLHFKLDGKRRPYSDWEKGFDGNKHPNWHMPFWDSDVRAFIFATHNEALAKRHNAKPATKIPAAYTARDGSQLLRELSWKLGWVTQSP